MPARGRGPGQGGCGRRAHRFSLAWQSAVLTPFGSGRSPRAPDRLLHARREITSGKRRHPAHRHVDMQRHQLLRRDAMAALGMEHLVEVVQPLGVRAQQMRHHTHPLAHPHLALVQRVRLGGERRVAGGIAIRLADAQHVVQQVRRLIEQHDVIGQVHMAVGIDPLGQDHAFELRQFHRRASLLTKRHRVKHTRTQCVRSTCTSMEVTDGLPPRQRWRAMLAVAIAVAMSVLVTSIANIALPTIARDMDATPADVDLGGERLPARGDGDAAAVRLDRRHLRPSARLCLGPRGLHRRIAALRGRAVAAGAGDRPRAAGLRRRRHHERQRRAGALHLSARGCSAAASASTRWSSRVHPPPARRSRRRSCRCCPGPGCSHCRCRRASSRCGWRTASCRGRRSPAIRSIR